MMDWTQQKQRVHSGYWQSFVLPAYFPARTCRVRSRAETWGIVLYICPSISLSWETMGAKSCVRVFTDFSKMAHTAWGRTSGQLYCHSTKSQVWLHTSATHLHNLRVVEPLTEQVLYESKDLLQNHHHLTAGKRKKLNLNEKNALKQAAKLNISISMRLCAGRKIWLWLNKKSRSLSFGPSSTAKIFCCGGSGGGDWGAGTAGSIMWFVLSGWWLYTR